MALVRVRSNRLLVTLILATVGWLALLRALSWARPQASYNGQPAHVGATAQPSVGSSDSPPPADAALEPALARQLAGSGPDEVVAVILVLEDQADPGRLVGVGEATASGRQRVVAGLQSVAGSSQAPIRAQLEDARAAGLVEAFVPFWIFNGVAVRAKASFVRSLAAYPQVSQIRLDHRRQWLEPAPPCPACERSTEIAGDANGGQPVEWNIARIRAPDVWASLRISGTGAVVAGMDTGVDWLHPALLETYRGYLAGSSPEHAGNWFDAVSGSDSPADHHGHGTHTLGTAVGRTGIGVAPGAAWIGVKVLDAEGYAYDSWIHAGFEWLLAPGGDAALAPDVVNCSWGSPLAELTTFQGDLQVLKAASIVAVFSAGNSGPGESTVGSPASLPEALAVGATDDFDEVTTFSSRGPSPWGDIRPHVAAPGAYVRSSLTGGGYVVARGTSMAAPHVAGLAALLRSVSPTLGVDAAVHVITSTALPLGDPVPNNDVGWGRVDALAAVSLLASPGVVSGEVTDARDGGPIVGASIVAVARSGGGRGTAATDETGAFHVALAPGSYELMVDAFGYIPRRFRPIRLSGGGTVEIHVPLWRRPSGALEVRLLDRATGEGITGTITVLGTPLEARASVYEFRLPRGSYSIKAAALGYGVVTATAYVIPGFTTHLDAALDQIPSILLVDSGAWLYASQAAYFRQALGDLELTYSEWPIRRLPDDVPSTADLQPYDVVIWSAPSDAPGYIGAEDAVAGYLSAGGRLLLTGQDVGYLDGGGWDSRPYYREYLKARFVRDSSESWQLRGAPGDIYSGLVLTIAGAGGAGNQAFPDEIAVADPDAAAEVLTYDNDGCGGLRVGTCVGYRAVYLSFGFEAIADRRSRSELMGRTLDWLMSDPPAARFDLRPAAHTAIGLPGDQVTHSVRVRCTGMAGITDTIVLSVVGAEWPTRVNPQAVALGSCQSLSAVVTVTVPTTATWDARDIVTLSARSSLSPSLAHTAVLTSKAPAPVLLVDDDRFFEQSEKYEAALREAGLAFDLWRTCPATGWCREHSPSLSELLPYPIVAWWTGYDWYLPVTPQQLDTLDGYMDAGGRLFLSSQDYLYHHLQHPFTQRSLGVLTYTEDVTVTTMSGVPYHPVSDGLGPYDLDYPFPSMADSVHPIEGSSVMLRDQAGRGAALNTRAAHRATVFLAFPFESLPVASRAQVAQQALGWLSWLGASRFEPSAGSVAAGARLRYTLQLINDGPDAVLAAVSNTLPGQLSMLPWTLTEGAEYDPASRRVTWDGRVEPSSSVVLVYEADVASGEAPGQRIENVAELALVEQAIRFSRAAIARIDAPDLAGSDFCSPRYPLLSGEVLSACFVVVNDGVSDASAARVSVSFPRGTSLLTDSVHSGGVGACALAKGGLTWVGPLTVGQAVTLSYQLRLPPTPSDTSLDFVAYLADGAGGAWERTSWLNVQPWTALLPLVTWRPWPPISANRALSRCDEVDAPPGSPATPRLVRMGRPASWLDSPTWVERAPVQDDR